jgi:hypothetical protein
VAQKQRLENVKSRFEELQGLGTEYSVLEGAGQDDELSRLEEELVSLAAGVSLMEDEEPRLRELLAAADQVQRETKIERILSLVDSRFAGRSVLFFTEYKATQSLLMSQLISRFGDGRVAFINGDGRADEVIDRAGQVRTLHQTKEEAADLFNEGGVEFLVSTEAGGEGIDLQERCHSLVHVDLPWNPMRLHQRVGRLNRYGQKHRVEVVTLRNPDTVESRIWEKLNHKIENVMLAFGHVMDEPEDLLQMVLGMTSPALFRELFAEASQVPSESMAAWFDQKAATFGGRDVIETVKEIVGNCDRFDYQSMGKDVPPVDLPDLKPFFEAMLIQNRRRSKRGEDGSLSFKTPDQWLREVGVRPAYDGLTFDRSVRGKDAVQRVVGVGHKAMDQALRQALEESAAITSVAAELLPRPILVARISDRVTGAEGPVRSVVVAVEQSAETGDWTILRDWELVQRLNSMMMNMSALRKVCTPSAESAAVKGALEIALAVVEAEVPRQDLNFRVPTVEPVAVFWPGVAKTGSLPGSGEGDPDLIEDLE